MAICSLDDVANKRGVLKMKIAQVASLYESVPPKLYGGTERVVSYLTEDLINQSHEVTLFASADSTTKARLAPCAQALGLDNAVKHPLVHYYIQLRSVLDEVEQCDIVHFHIGYLHFPRLIDSRCRT